MCQLLLFCLNLFVFISALKINHFAALGKKESIKLLFNLCLIWKQFQNTRYKQDKVHL